MNVRKTPRRMAGIVMLALAVAPIGACGSAEADSSRPASEDGRLAAAKQETGGERQGGQTAGHLVQIRVGGHVVQVEIADDVAERQRGMMGRESLPDDEGMLFVYNSEGTPSFWMKNTPHALDIAFVDRAGRIFDIQTMEPTSEEYHTSPRPAMYALEMRAGWFVDFGVKVGDTIQF